MSFQKKKLLVIDLEDHRDGCTGTVTVKEDSLDTVFLNMEPGRYKLEEVKEAIKAAEEFLESFKPKEAPSATEGIPGDYINLP